MAVKKKYLFNQKGQSVVEFLVFLPFIIMMYSITLSISNSISASINQQKITRGYFYFLLAGNSTAPYPRREGGAEITDAYRLFGMQLTGWMEEFSGNSEPIAPCFKFNLLLGEGDDECEEGYSEQTTQFIRVMTVYGICGATYQNIDGYPIAYPRAAIGATSPVNRCVLQ